MRRIGQRAWHAAALAASAVALIALLAAPASARAPRLPAARGRAGVGRARRWRFAQFKKYDRAVAAQRDQLSTARSRARRAGCGFSLLAIGSAMCAPLNAQIERMERNLEALERKRVALSGGGGSTRDRARILASLDANNCRDTEVAEREPPRRNGSSLFERLFGNDVPEGLPMEEPERQPFERQPFERSRAPARRGASRHPPTSRASSTRTARSRSSARPATSPPCACAPATAITFRCRPTRRRPISTAT